MALSSRSITERKDSKDFVPSQSALPTPAAAAASAAGVDDESLLLPLLTS